MFIKRSVPNHQQFKLLFSRVHSLSHLTSDSQFTTCFTSRSTISCLVGLFAAAGAFVMPASGANNLDVDIVFVKEQIETAPGNSYVQVIYNTRYKPTDQADIYRLNAGENTPINLTQTGANGAATDPDIWFEGTKMVFTKRVGDASTSQWHLYEYDFNLGTTTALTGPSSNDTGCPSNDPDDIWNFDDVDPCYLPNGNIIFTSNRAGTLNEYEMQLNEVLHILDPTSGKVRQISFFLSGDYNPAVLHDGRIYWMRYEHVGRFDFFPLMSSRPDGSQVEEFFGFKSPIKCFTEFTQLPEPDGRIISTANWHFFTYSAGGLVAIDPREGPVDEVLSGYDHEVINNPYDPNDGGVVDLTPNIPCGLDLNEDGSEYSRYWENGAWKTDGRYRTPNAIYTGKDKGKLLASWDDGWCAQYEGSVQSMTDTTHFPDFGIWLLSFDPDTGLIVRDNMIYNDATPSLRPVADLDARPIEPRPMPPEIKSYYDAEKTEGVFTCLNVYENSLDFRAFYPEKLGDKVRVRATQPALDNSETIEVGDISAVRITENLPVYAEGNTHRRLAHYHHEPARILGDVPVSSNGSFKVKVPTGTALRFQTLDNKGRTLSTQFTSIYLQPGENKVCIGCHEERGNTPSNRQLMADAAKTVDALAPTNSGPEIVHFTRDVQPILNKYCALSDCHDSDEPMGELDLSDDVSSLYDSAFNSLLPWTRPTSIRKSELTRMMTGRRKIGNCGMPVAPGYGISNSKARAGYEVLTTDEWEILARWIELGVMFRFSADGQVASPFTLADSNAKIKDPILAPRCMLPVCHGEGDATHNYYTGAQAVFNLARLFSDSGGGPIIPMERAVNLTHPDRSRLLRAPYMSTEKAKRQCTDAGWDQTDRDAALADFMTYGCGNHNSDNNWGCHPANQIYYLNVLGDSASFLSKINGRCDGFGAMNSTEQTRMLNWLSEFAGNWQRPTCPTLWTNSTPDYVTIKNYIEAAADEFVGDKNAATATANQCTACHTASKYNTLTKDKAGWKKIVMRMLGQEHDFGFRPEAEYNGRNYIMFAPEAAIIGQYLAETYGAEPAVQPDSQSRTADQLFYAARNERYHGSITLAETYLRQALLASPTAYWDRRIRIDLGRIYTQYEDFYLNDTMVTSRPQIREAKH